MGMVIDRRITLSPLNRPSRPSNPNNKNLPNLPPNNLNLNLNNPLNNNKHLNCTPKSDVETADTSPATKDLEVDGFSDGGLSAWLTVFGAFLALFCSFGQMNAFGTFQSWYTTHQLCDLHPSTVAWIGSVQLWVFFFSVSETSYPRFEPEAAHQCARLGWFHRPRV